MPQSKQVHIFATRSDLEPGLRVFESKSAVKYVRRDLYHGPTFEQYLTLLDWAGLGKNNTGEHMTGPCFLVLKRDAQVNVETVPQHATPAEIVQLAVVRAAAQRAGGESGHRAGRSDCG